MLHNRIDYIQQQGNRSPPLNVGPEMGTLRGHYAVTLKDDKALQAKSLSPRDRLFESFPQSQVFLAS
jgi:hypothetical protein